MDLEAFIGRREKSWFAFPRVVLRPIQERCFWLEEFLKPFGMSQTELAAKIGVSYPRVNELIHGKRGITPDTALRLEQLFGMEAQFWLNLQLAWDLYHLLRSPAAKRIRKIKQLPALVAVVSR